MTTGDALPKDVAGLRALVLRPLVERDELAGPVERMNHMIREFQEGAVWPALGEARIRSAGGRHGDCDVA